MSSIFIDSWIVYLTSSAEVEFSNLHSAYNSNEKNNEMIRIINFIILHNTDKLHF